MALAASARDQARPRPGQTLLALLFAAAALLLLAPDAAAFRQWCRTDPIVRIGGETVNIFVSSDPAILGQALGPTEVVIGVPKGVATELIMTDDGFGYGETVTFVRTPKPRGNKHTGAIDVVVSVYVPAADGTLPVLVEFIPQDGTPPTTVEGLTNTWITLRATV